MVALGTQRKGTTCLHSQLGAPSAQVSACPLPAPPLLAQWVLGAQPSLDGGIQGPPQSHKDSNVPRARMATVGPRTGPNAGAEALALAAELQGEATCSICLEFFREPVSVECGHSFCRACITRCWERPGAGTGTATRTLPCPLPCPQCREPARPSQLRPNRQLAAVASLLRRFSLPPTAPGERGTPAVAARATAARCSQHGEQLKLYCQDDGRAICVVCDRAREHRSHAVLPLEEAVQEAKVGAGCPRALAVLHPSQLPLRTVGGVLQKSPGLPFLSLNCGFLSSPLVPQSPDAWRPGRRPQGLEMFLSVPQPLLLLCPGESVYLSCPHIFCHTSTAFPGAWHYTNYQVQRETQRGVLG